MMAAPGQGGLLERAAFKRLATYPGLMIGAQYVALHWAIQQTFDLLNSAAGKKKSPQAISLRAKSNPFGVWRRQTHYTALQHLRLLYCLDNRYTFNE
jgi:hypothetical protein